MARALFSGVGIAGMSGSINKKAGGTTFSKNGVVRRRVVPVNPQTSYQQEIRAFFEYLTKEWSALTESQRLSWETARTGNDYFQKQDPLTGVSRPYASAKDLFIGLNLNFALGDGSIGTPAVQFTEPGTSAGIDTLGITSVAFDASSGSATVTYTGTPTLEMIVVKATNPVSAGNSRVTSVKSKFRYLDIGGGLGTSPANIGTSYTGRFGAITAETGKKVFWTIEGVNIVTGVSRLIAQGSSIIVA